MRKLFLHFAVTADGMVSNVEQWVSFTDEALKDASAWHDTVDTIIFGNNNYAPLAGLLAGCRNLVKISSRTRLCQKD